MSKQVAYKLLFTISTTIFSCVLLMQAKRANAIVFSFQQGGFGVNPGESGSLSGTFSGADLNNDGSIDLSTHGELDDFSLNVDFSTTFFGQFIGSNFTLTKNDLENFSYSPSSASPLAFTAGNPSSFFTSVSDCLAASNPTSFGCGIPLVSVGMPAIQPETTSLVLAFIPRGGGCNCELFSSQEVVEVVEYSTSVPESRGVGGMVLLGLGAGGNFLKKKMSSEYKL